MGIRVLHLGPQILGVSLRGRGAKMMELLAPAGGMEQLRYALHFGADAVYLGGKRFGLRARASNFSDVELAQAVSYAHAEGKRVHVTVNALMRDADLGELREYLAMLGEYGADAVIASDLAVMRIAREVAPGVEIHVSTQASCTNALAARQYYELGAKRVVLARELSVAQIAQLREDAPAGLELEVFVHGAMCMSYSGRCLISAYLTGRDANRGACTQPCRWGYVLQEETRPGEYFPIEEDEQGAYILSSRDLMMLEHLDDLERAGVSSIKIEGRVKSGYYVACVVNSYRQVLDGVSAAVMRPELEAVSHRPYGTGFFYGPAHQTYAGAAYSQTHDWVAVVRGCERVNNDRWRVTVEQRNRFFTGDELEALSPGKPVRKLTADGLRTDLGQLCETANQAMRAYSFECEYELSYDDILRKRRV